MLKKAKALSESILATLFEETSDGVLLISINERKQMKVTCYNSLAKKIFQFSDDVKGGYVLHATSFPHMKPLFSMCAKVCTTHLKTEFSLEIDQKGNVNTYHVKIIPFLAKPNQYELLIICSIGKIESFSSNNDIFASGCMKSIMDGSENAITIKSLEGKVVYANRAYTQLLGWDQHEVIGKTSIELTVIPKECTHEFASIQKQLWNGKSFSHFETKRIHKDGRIVYVSATYTNYYDANQNIIGTLCVFRDITKQKIYEAKLAESEERYRKLVEVLPLGVLVHQHEKILYSNPKILKMIGHTNKHSFIGENIDTFFHIKDRETVKKQSKKQRFEEGVWHKINGKPMSLESTSTSIYINNEPATLTIFNDVSERKRHEKELHESESRYRIIADNMSEMISIVDQYGIIKYASPSYKKMLGYMPASILGMNLFDLVNRPEREKVEKAFETLLVSGEVQRVEFRHLRCDGSKIWLEAIGKKIVCKKEGYSFLVVCREIMERKKNEEVIRKLDKLSAVGQLAAGVAHEIRNPLTSIKGFLQLFQSQLPSELNKEYWDIVFSELNRIELIVNEFMVLAKPQSVPLGRLNLNRIIHNTIKLFDTQAILHNISIKIHHVDSEKTQIIGNENHLKQLLINVLKNSLEATPKFGKIMIKIELFRESNVRIRVIDNGKGITKEKLSMIGTPFYTTKEKGIGLGLTMSQKIVQEHNGTFRILSKRCFGTIVDIELPTV